MTYTRFNAPSTRRLLVATVAAALCAAVLLVTVVFPAEYGRDPTGVGRLLGLDTLYSAATQTQPNTLVVDEAPTERKDPSNDNAFESRKAVEVFGESAGQSFATDAVSRYPAGLREERMQVTLPPGKGAEVKANMQAGDAVVFHWSASAEVAVDMHGDRVGAGQDEFTTYWIEGAQREASGQFTAPFEGAHGWYWQNRSNDEVSVEVFVIGQYESLFRPGH